jgi:hypothetical protein
MTTRQQYRDRNGDKARRKHNGALRYLSMVIASVLLAGCSEPACPTKGWVTDRCAPNGPFPAAGITFYIPNTQARHFKWQGGVHYDVDTKTIVSPNLAMHWTNREPAVTKDWPSDGEDVVAFSLTYSPPEPSMTGMEAKYPRGFVPFDVPLPFKAPGLASMVPYDTEPYSNPDWAGSGSDTYFLVARSVTGAPSAVFRCEAKHSPYAKHPYCDGTFEPRPGLIITFSIKETQMPRWEEVLASFKTLLLTWEKKSKWQTIA